jgi:hypothetical protein
LKSGLFLRSSPSSNAAINSCKKCGRGDILSGHICSTFSGKEMLAEADPGGHEKSKEEK